MQDQEKERAEIFDAFAHPTRINILKLLSHGGLGFADLKKKTGIESSGHLQHHLAKLDGLIRTDEHGNYRLSDAGNDALFTLQTVEAASRKGRHRVASDSQRFRFLLSAIVVTLVVCLVASTLYLSNNYVSLNRAATQTLDDAKADLNQYAIQYVCDVMTGSLHESGSLWIGPSDPRPLAPQEWFNYTAVVIPESEYSHSGYSLNDCATVPVFSPPVSNDTYYSQGFLEYELQIFGLNGSDTYHAQMYPIIGPDGWNGQILSPFVFQEFPPYPTVRTSTDTTGRLSGSVPFSSRSIVPISIFGNYTFCVRNGGNTTMQISFRITTPIVTLETRPLTVGSYPAWDPDFATERIVRIREESGGNQSYPTLSATIPDTTTTALNTVALEILCTVALGALSIFVINHKKTLRTTLEKMT